MKHYEIQEMTDGKWKRFLYWYGMKKGYATGAFRMLVGFSTTGIRYRLISSDGEVIEEKQSASVPKINYGRS